MSNGGSFVFLRYPPPQEASHDYLANVAAAKKVVRALQEMGAQTLLIIAASFEECRTIGDVISGAGMQFYTDERWPWFSALDQAGRFDSQRYIETRVVSELEPLKDQFGDTFAGVYYPDEPGLADLDALSALTDCLRSRQSLAELSIFLNLLPIHANYAGMSGLARELSGARMPADFGVDCQTGEVNTKVAQLMAHGYGRYVRIATDKARPSHLAFNLYPFDEELSHCEAARELTVSENLSNISNVSRISGIVPVAYLQNFQVAGGFYANFHHLRWFASWAFAFGVRNFANFVSHSYAGDSETRASTGLLDSRNSETALASDQRSLFGFVRYLQRETDQLEYLGFVAPFLGVNSGQIVANCSSGQTLLGEYRSPNGATVFLFAARRHVEGPAEATALLWISWGHLERLDIASGQWEMVARSSNELHIELSAFPGALYRLSA